MLISNIFHLMARLNPSAGSIELRMFSILLYCLVDTGVTGKQNVPLLEPIIQAFLVVFPDMSYRKIVK